MAVGLQRHGLGHIGAADRNAIGAADLGEDGAVGQPGGFGQGQRGLHRIGEADRQRLGIGQQAGHAGHHIRRRVDNGEAGDMAVGLHRRRLRHGGAGDHQAVGAGELGQQRGIGLEGGAGQGQLRRAGVGEADRGQLAVGQQRRQVGLHIGGAVAEGEAGDMAVGLHRRRLGHGGAGDGQGVGAGELGQQRRIGLPGRDGQGQLGRGCVGEADRGQLAVGQQRRQGGLHIGGAVGDAEGGDLGIGLQPGGIRHLGVVDHGRRGRAATGIVQRDPVAGGQQRGEADLEGGGPALAGMGAPGVADLQHAGAGVDAVDRHGVAGHQRGAAAGIGGVGEAAQDDVAMRRQRGGDGGQDAGGAVAGGAALVGHAVVEAVFGPAAAVAGEFGDLAGAGDLGQGVAGHAAIADGAEAVAAVAVAGERAAGLQLGIGLFHQAGPEHRRAVERMPAIGQQVADRDVLRRAIDVEAHAVGVVAVVGDHGGDRRAVLLRQLGQGGQQVAIPQIALVDVVHAGAGGGIERRGIGAVGDREAGAVHRDGVARQVGAEQPLAGQLGELGGGGANGQVAQRHGLGAAAGPGGVGGIAHDQRIDHIGQVGAGDLALVQVGRDQLQVGELAGRERGVVGVERGRQVGEQLDHAGFADHAIDVGGGHVGGQDAVVDQGDPGGDAGGQQDGRGQQAQLGRGQIGGVLGLDRDGHGGAPDF